ncbi:hypothetical protein BpHYR1_013249 [Brachionus plicatilis]|uniref:Uncharacterized protein n=1 Tax=Brachionus plicatilis TaxID=10195 RepID=A0A3M7S0Z6_BRAPC|nr:hypothetical protein BpHYR1_013249 [Brachionus plicatilis]
MSDFELAEFKALSSTFKDIKIDGTLYATDKEERLAFKLLNGRQRTNNTLEAWHLAFENDVGKHPTIKNIVDRSYCISNDSSILEYLDSLSAVLFFLLN